MLQKFLMAAVALAAIATQARAEVVVAPPAPVRFGKLVVKGKVSEYPRAYVSLDINGKLSATAANLSGQESSYKAYRFKTNAQGRPIKLSAEMDNEQVGELNKPLRLESGHYILIYQETLAVTEVKGGETTEVALLKVRAPQAAGASGVKLSIDMTSIEEQNKQMFWTRMNSTYSDYVNSFRATDWGRLNVAKYIDSGASSDLTTEARKAFFTDKGETCPVQNDGSQGYGGYYSWWGYRTSYAAECSRQTVGEWNNTISTSNCQQVYEWSTGLFPQKVLRSKCDSRTRKLSWESAYFLVFPGTYIMEWQVSEGSNPERMGVVVSTETAN